MSNPSRLAGRAREGFLCALLAGAPLSNAFGWGQYAHEEINLTAVELMDPNSGLAPLFAANARLIERLGITPDIEWKSKNGGGAEEDEPDKASSAEGPLHYFEADTFLGAMQRFEALPSGEWRTAQPRLQSMLRANATALLRLDPTETLQAAAHGTAPWRALQLYDLGVNALRRGDIPRALLYLGTMGHYVGDMSQPLHATSDFDGSAFRAPAAGIHSAFESRIFSNAAHKVSRQPFDYKNLLWNLSATHARVKAKAAARLQDAKPLRRGDIVAALLSEVKTGMPLLEPLLAAFSEQCARAQRGELRGTEKLHRNARFCVEHKGGRPFVSRAIVEAFASARIGGGSVMELAEERMALSAAILARIWEAAYNDAGKPPIQAARYAFKSVDAIGNYPMPSYLGAKGLQMSFSEFEDDSIRMIRRSLADPRGPGLFK